MKEIKDLDEVIGGTVSFSGSIINSFVNLFKIINEVGRSIGSAIRRVSEDNVCPLK